MDALTHAIRNTPIIDHHAHNLLLPHELEARPFLAITTESGDLETTKSTLSHLRAVKQLSSILKCEPTWGAVESSIKRTDEWSKLCFQGIETVLIDDGLDSSTVHPWDWHHALTNSKCKRIVRIEKVAEDLLEELKLKKWHDVLQLCSEWIQRFKAAILAGLADPNVAGFKSVICYRTGLSIPERTTPSSEIMRSSMKRIISSDKFPRLEDEHLSPYFLHLAAQLISDAAKPKPLQFHTGLGDNDITLNLSSPSHLQPFIKSNPKLPIVLLHASYPFTKEAGYLASVYENVYLDIGEVFPMVSQEGQESVIRESLELCPSEKLMWSTDGHWFPETYLLAVLQVREGLEYVLGNSVRRGVMETAQAIKFVEDMFFNTANRLYDLGLSLSSDSSSPTLGNSSEKFKNIDIFTAFLERNPSVKYLRLQWVDFTSVLRLRIIPIKEAKALFYAQKSIGITKAGLGLLQVDSTIPEFSPVGEYKLIPCFDSLKLGERDGYATIQGEFCEKDGTEVSICPRTGLRRQTEKASERGISFLMGFEIEVVFMNYEASQGKIVFGNSPATQGHAWSAAGPLRNNDIMSMVEKVVDQLGRSGIEVTQFHPESAPGQFEFITGPLPPLQAVDTLIASREIICAVAEQYSMRATLVPKPFTAACGTGAHVHISLTPEKEYPFFYAGVLKHLRSIAAFSLCNASSYERVVDHFWGGGRYVAWGTQNRECPLRKIEGSHWEYKWMDGFANPYLAMAAFIGAGLQGVNEGIELPSKDMQQDPAMMTAEERKAHGITEMLPTNIEEALEGLAKDESLKAILGTGLIETYLAVKQGEMKLLGGMEEDERRRFLIERY